MVITDAHRLPTNEELTVEEVKLSYSTLHGAAFHLGKYCEPQNNVSNFFFFFFY